MKSIIQKTSDHYVSLETLHTWELLGQTLSEGSQGIFQVPHVEVAVYLSGRDLCMR
jgi:hypothetical protein